MFELVDGVLQLLIEDDASYQQIAESLGAPLNTVRVWILRGRRALRRSSALGADVLLVLDHYLHLIGSRLMDDREIGELWNTLQSMDAYRGKTTMIITADHGNAECMVDPITGGPHTYHTTNPVPFILVDDFAAKPGTPNMFGLVQGEGNAIAPRKRPLS